MGRLYGRGRLPTASEIEAAARELLAAPAAQAQPEQAKEPQSVQSAPRRETLMEID